MTADPAVRALLLKAVKAQQEGEHEAGQPIVMLDKKYNAQRILKIARSVSLSEITALMRASDVREKGLAAVKAGDIANGEALLRKARYIFSEAGLSKEAFVSADSFQYPAEAYLQYKRGAYEQAEASLLRAIELCRTLRDEYEHQVEVRRIHLARNVVRIRTATGMREEALRMASLLVGYLEGDQSQWPFPEIAMMSPPDPLLSEERWSLMDQVLGEVAILVTCRSSTSHRLVEGSAGWLFRGGKTFGEFARVHSWLAARRASIEGDAKEFLTHGLAFFGEKRGYLRQSWRELTSDLVTFCRAIAPDVLTVGPGDLNSRKIRGTESAV